MVTTKKVKIKLENGLHARVLAMIVHKSSELQKKFNVKLFIYKKESEKIPANSLMALISLRVKKNEDIIIEAVGDNTVDAVFEMCLFLESNLDMPDKSTINQIDNILNANTIALEQVVLSIANGLIVTDENDIITVFNPAAEKILGLPVKEVIGKKVQEKIPASRLHIISRTQKEEIGFRQVIGNSVVITNRTPLVVDGKSKGAVAIFEDVSHLEKVTGELKEVKELKERLQLILDSVQDGICVLDKDGFITYVNCSYLNILKESKENIIGKSIEDISPQGIRKKVLYEGQNVIGALSTKTNGVSIISNVSPIIVDGEIRGVVSIVKNVLEVQALSEKLNKVSAKAKYLEEELFRTKKPTATFNRFIGFSGKVMDALAIASKAAKTNATTLIRGESGTGKELIAEGIHYASSRVDGPFIRVNCAAIPEGLLESELFGHEKGAFTGAIKRKLGKFELAHKGSIFLDEIGEMKKSMQVKLLRILQEKEFQRVGGEESISVDVRIIAATNRNLEEMMKQGDFREDLYFRLNVIPIFLPPLRERKEDIPILAEHFMKKKGEFIGKQIEGITSKAMDLLIEYSWPGNGRELENIIERVLTLADGSYVQVSDLPLYIRETTIKTAQTLAKSKESIIDKIENEEEVYPIKVYEKIIIEKALKKYGSYNAAGKALGLTHKTVASKARLYGIEKIVTWEK